MDSIDQTMKTHALPHDMRLKRIESSGLSFGLVNIRDIADSVGTERKWLGFTSTTHPDNSDVQAQPGQVSITLLAPKGTRGVAIEQLSKYPNEQEVLLNRGINVRVVESRYNEDEGIAHAVVEVIQNGGQ